MRQAKTIDYQAIEQARGTEIKETIRRKLHEKDWGRSNSLRHVILKLVVEGHYDAAKTELDGYIEDKKDFADFQMRVESFRSHCDGLIHAIRSKRTLPGLGGLSIARQQELYDRVDHHFEELKQYLKQIEKVERDIKLSDIRSTAWLIKAVTYSVGVVFLIAFIREFTFGGAESFAIVASDLADQFSTWVFRLVGLI